MKESIICAGGGSNVFISTHDDNTDTDSSENFSLRAATDGMFLQGVLCENGWYKSDSQWPFFVVKKLSYI